MKVFIIISILLGYWASVDAQDAFIPGTVWTTYIEGSDYPNPTTGIETAVMHSGNEGEDLMRLVITDSFNTDIEEVYFIKKDGECVFFSYPTTPPEWKLLYDFSLRPEEGCDIYSPWQVDERSYRITYDVCKALSPAPNGIVEMEMYEYSKSGHDQESDPYFYEGTWFKGIGSIAGVIRPNIFGTIGVGYVLLDVRNGDTVFYSNPAAVKDLELTQLQMTIKDGKLTYTELADPVDVMIINTDGTILLQSIIHGTGSLSLPGGLSIIRVGGRAFKALGR